MNDTFIEELKRKIALVCEHVLQKKRLTQCFSTFFGSRHPIRPKKIWRHPYLAKMPIWATLSSKKNLKGSKFNIWRHP
jgi:hypothetical protein